jgi:polysaccharide export outer membrane protein
MAACSRPGAALTIVVSLFFQAACAKQSQTLYPAEQNPTQVLSEGATAPARGRSILPQDLLQVTVFEAEELGGAFRVSDAGEIAVPLVGPINARGRTPRELEQALVAKLRATYMHDPHVTVEVKEEAPRPIYVLGEVAQPGAFSTAGQDGLTLLRAVTIARGLTPRASHKRAFVIRTMGNGDRLQMTVNLEDVLKGRAADMALQANDVVYIPKNTERAVATGVIDALLRVFTFRAVF